ncbi:hypothetical protein WH06_22715 [Aeromonas salmonicida subsp. salmonicida]|uniref:Abort lactococcal phage infection AbiTii n=4 Tax=Aeromonas salmonicida TaxID=645 RepID=A0A1Q4MCH4_AERSS|nr:hypothetical protein [Aeromonas salmonicida]ABO92577.1 conserved hypothetical protein [Aeromonas salmonicida subsp. salmonicida A449]ASD49298.1 Abort lactococcal phage infection AbiTii [Aeromonas salmonicida subsp. salmonicida]EHI50288.1 hypothetical protein IYQ_22475 [Aeromonas salmonicida subsp. salmonicida 01-B526]EKP0241595.1 hypothetical protein [Aeromonas salmonicida]EKP0245684.1 hypothetical protein [Aeromonas salmonicida]
MPALIHELIAMASDPAVKTTDLLRKALVAARLLKQHEWAAWINNELQGYPDGVDLPAYRLLRGELKAYNPVRGLIPLHTPSTEIAEKLSTCRFNCSVTELEELATSEFGVRYLFPPELAEALRGSQRLPMTPEVAVDACKVRGQLGAVRDKVLIWALDLAEAGIHGEGMTFTAQERQQAQQFAIHIGGDFNGGQLMVSSPGGQQQQTVTGEQKEAAIAALLPWLAQVIEQGQLQREVCAELQAELDTLKAQAASPNPKWPVIGAVAGSVRTILEGAGGASVGVAGHLDRQLINIGNKSGAAAPLCILGQRPKPRVKGRCRAALACWR